MDFSDFCSYKIVLKLHKKWRFLLAKDFSVNVAFGHIY